MVNLGEKSVPSCDNLGRIFAHQEKFLGEFNNSPRNFHILQAPMGAGKTRMCILAFLEKKKQDIQLQLVVVAPLVLHTQWEDECRAFNIALIFLRRDSIPDLDGVPSFSSHIFLICDECTSFRNFSSKRTKRLEKLIKMSYGGILCSGTLDTLKDEALVTMLALKELHNYAGISLQGVFYDFAKKHGYFTKTPFGQKFTLKKKREKFFKDDLNAIIINSDEIDLPKITVDEINIFENVESDAAHSELVKKIEELAELCASDDFLENVNFFKYMQMMSGWVYSTSDNLREVIFLEKLAPLYIHKITSTLALFEKIGKERLIVFYIFEEEKNIIKELCYFSGRPFFEKETLDSYISSTCPKNAVLTIHPASCGFGLNLQRDFNIFWFSLPISIEQLLQGNARILRPGQINKCNIFYYLSPFFSKKMTDVIKRASKRLVFNKKSEIC